MHTTNHRQQKAHRKTQNKCTPRSHHILYTMLKGEPTNGVKHIAGVPIGAIAVMTSSCCKAIRLSRKPMSHSNCSRSRRWTLRSGNPALQYLRQYSWMFSRRQHPSDCPDGSPRCVPTTLRPTQQVFLEVEFNVLAREEYEGTLLDDRQSCSQTLHGDFASFGAARLSSIPLPALKASPLQKTTTIKTLKK